MHKKFNFYRAMASSVLFGLLGSGCGSNAEIKNDPIHTQISAGPNCGILYPSIAPPHYTGTDPLLTRQWHLKNTGQGGGTPGEDIRAFDAWTTTRGSGVIVAVIDDAVEILHPDLYPNVVIGSKTYRQGNTSGMPLPCNTTGESHGTSVAAIIAAKGGNGVGVSGVAPDASIIGLDALSNKTVLNFFDALTRDLHRVSVYNSSWSSPYGRVIRPVFPEFEEAIKLGVEIGRQSNGVIYVFASGNGGPSDNSNYDGFLTGHGTIAVCQVDEHGKKTPTSQPGANLLVCAPGYGSDDGIVTAATGGGYTTSFKGTSAAAPVVSGVAALLLAARPKNLAPLSWRDVQLILAKTARKNDPADPAWRRTTGGSGWVHPYYGYGVVDAAAAVKAAQTWVTVGGSSQQRKCSSGTVAANLPIPEAGGNTLTTTLELLCPELSYIEYVEVTATIEHGNSGDLRIEVATPSGQVSRLADARVCSSKLVTDPCGTYYGWRFGLKHHQDENPNGIWTLSVSDLMSGNTGALTSWRVVVHGR